MQIDSRYTPRMPISIAYAQMEAGTLPPVDRSVIVQFNFEGVHYWQGAEKIPGIEYLANVHRHIFYVYAVKRVEHNDRDLEIQLLRRAMMQYITRGEQVARLTNMSCEDIAQLLLVAFDLEECRVLEDNENGASIRKPKTT